MDDSYKKNKKNQLTSTDGVDVILCILMVSYQRCRRFVYTYLNISLQKRNVGTGAFYTHDVLSKRSVSRSCNVTNTELIYLIFLKEILSVDIQLSILDSEVKPISPCI